MCCRDRKRRTRWESPESLVVNPALRLDPVAPFNQNKNNSSSTTHLGNTAIDNALRFPSPTPSEHEARRSRDSTARAVEVPDVPEVPEVPEAPPSYESVMKARGRHSSISTRASASASASASRALTPQSQPNKKPSSTAQNHRQQQQEEEEVEDNNATHLLDETVSNFSRDPTVLTPLTTTAPTVALSDVESERDDETISSSSSRSSSPATHSAAHAANNTESQEHGFRDRKTMPER